MTVTRLGHPFITLTSGYGSSTQIPGGGTSGQGVVSNGSNGSYWADVVQRITANGSNALLGPFVNFISGSGITLSVSSNSMTITGLSGSGSFLEVVGGGKGTVVNLGNLGATETINVASGNYFYGTLDANCTIGFTGWTAGKDSQITVELIEDGTGGRTPTFSGVTWLGGTTPTHDTTAGTTTVYVFFSRDGGITIIGGQLGAGSTSPLTTKGDLYTFSTVNARLAVGSNGAALIADSAATTGNRWSSIALTGELLILDTPAGSPLVFADLLQNEAGTDLLYADP